MFAVRFGTVTCVCPPVLQISADGLINGNNSEIMVLEEKMIMNGEPDDVSRSLRFKTNLPYFYYLKVLASNMAN